MGWKDVLDTGSSGKRSAVKMEEVRNISGIFPALRGMLLGGMFPLTNWRRGTRAREAKRRQENRVVGQMAFVMLIAVLGVLVAGAGAQTDCAEGNGVLDMSPPKNLTAQELIQKLATEETKIKEARTHYIYTQDVLVQTLSGKAVDGQFHEIASVSYDDKGKRAENVTFAEQSTLRGIQLSQQDMDDIRAFMPW